MTARWYVIHVYSGFENKVAGSIREQAQQKGLEDMFEEILVHLLRSVRDGQPERPTHGRGLDRVGRPGGDQLHRY